MNPDEPGPATTQAIKKAESKKAEYKKALILKTARQVLAARGFSSVTMNDIAAACGISRGGLYLYYASCEAIFADLMAEVAASYEDRADRVLSRKISPRDNLALYLREEAERCLSDEPELTRAVMEYGLAARPQHTGGKGSADGGAKHGKNVDVITDRERIRTAVQDYEKQEKRILEELIRRGRDAQEFMSCDPEAEADRIRIFMDGIRIRCLTGVMTEQEIHRETAGLMRDLAAETEHREQ